MKIMTVLGTRPEIIRLSLIIKKLDEFCDHILVHTGQNFEESLSDIFFKELEVRIPNYSLGIKAESFGEQVGKIIAETEKLMLVEKPDRLLILGDTNSGLSAITAKRMGIPVYHLEAGNRCYDDRVPEEVNRRIIDHSSDVLMPYTHRSKENLIREGIQRERIFIIGNPIFEVIQYFKSRIYQSPVLGALDIEAGKYFLVTMHRAENVDVQERLKGIIESLEALAKRYQLPIVCSLHPRTKSKMEQFGFALSYPMIKWLTPPGFFDFVALEMNAFCVLSDSGTVQEECCILKVPNVTIRDVTERPETIECGSNVLAGVDPRNVVSIVSTLVKQPREWSAPEEYLEANVSEKVLKILMGYRGAIHFCERNR